MRKLAVLLVLAFCLSVPKTDAQNREFRNAIHAKINLLDYGLPDGEELQLGEGFELGYSRNVAPFLNLSVPFKLGLAKLPGTSGNTVTTSFDLLFRLENMRNSAKVIPYAFGGAGYFIEDFDAGHLQFPFGAGLHFRVSKFAFVNLQGEFRKAQEDRRDNIQLGLGYVYLLHAAEPKQVLPPDTDKDGTPDALDKCPTLAGPPAALGCPDRDNDGLGDTEDLCPNDPGPLETKGCPDYDNDGFADNEDECPKDAGRWRGCPDTDFDGVPDKDDKCPSEAGPASNKGCPELKDADGDGFADNEDECPTQAGTNKGCPDSDGDGVADNYDRCPSVPGTPKNNGCPEVKDSDGDGVADDTDKCPGTAGPASNFGCPEVKEEVKKRLQFATKAVQFETAKATLKKESYPLLDEIIGIMREYPDYILTISGHTDDVGNDERNLRLSQDRAKTCQDYFVFRGIKAERLRSAGFGETRPIAPNDTPAGRESNRRVEFDLVLD
jgi:outer membrane protein OmpA-like peptidoglycan-associated protein